MSQQHIEYSPASAPEVKAQSQAPGASLLCAFLVVMFCLNLWLYSQGVDKMDVIAEGIVIYIVGPTLNALCGIILLVLALWFRKKYGRSVTIAACFIAAAVAPLLAMLVDAILIGAAFR